MSAPLTAKVTIELDGPVDQIAEWLAKLPAPPEVLTTMSQVLDEGLVEALVDRVSPAARDALREMAEHAPSITFKELQRKLGVDGLGLGGILASVGFAVRAGLPRPYRVDRAARRYVMEPETAELVLRALDARTRPAD